MVVPFRNRSSLFGDQPIKSQTLRRPQIILSSLALLLLSLISPARLAQGTSRADHARLIKSMGLPQIWKPSFSSMVVWDRRGGNNRAAGELNLSLCKDLVNPVTGILNVVGEGYIRSGDEVDWGGRLLGASRLFCIQGGVDYSFRDDKFNFLMSCTIPLRRGGLLRKGDTLRLDWFPGRRHSFSLGLSIPLWQPYMGKTRPTSSYIPLPKAHRASISTYTPESRLRKALANLRQAATWINRFTIPFLDQTIGANESQIEALVKMMKEFQEHIGQKGDAYPEGHTFQAEVDVYHREMERAFSLAAHGGRAVDGDSSGAWIAHQAREVLLDEVILPYNRLLGQRKKRDSVFGFGSRAATAFQTWLNASPDIAVEHHPALMYTFRTLIQCIEENRARSRNVWQNSRLVWIPMHYALRFRDHDTEKEMDAIIERAVGQPFTDANDVHYVVNELFQPELEKMIRRAEDYHVLWIHDYRGLNEAGEPDEVAYRQTVEGYLQALINKVEAYDTTRKIPVYMIFLDQHYFEVHHSRPWLLLLENPLGSEIYLPPKFSHWEERIRKAQNDLRAAVSQSFALQADTKRYGQQWLKNQIKVHVSITYPFDLSFRSPFFLNYFSFAPDNIIRDHRKIAFCDVTELDPGKGEAIYTGMGIGEHYVGPTWDDRSVLARGPVLLSLKEAARELFLSQGFDEDEIPAPLQPQPIPENYEEMLSELRTRGWTAWAMQIHNATGFGPKSANIVKAVLYNLMPTGSHLYIPDSLWNGPFWGGMLVGAALRGCKVLVISPALENAPSSGTMQMSRANELFTRFVVIQNQMRQEIEAAGGLFKVGIYTMDVDVGDVVGKVQAVNDGIAKSEVFQNLFPFAPEVIELVAALPEFLVSQGIQPSYLFDSAPKRRPKMHLKSQFFASGRAISTVTPLAGWEPVVRNYILARARQVTGRENLVDATDLRAQLEKDVAALIASWYGKGFTQQELDETFLFLTVGSHNQDYRSMIMDGESLVLIGHVWAMIAYLDFVSLMGQTTWVEDVQQLEELLPRHTGFWQWLGCCLKIAL